MKVRPLNLSILFKPKKPEEKTKGGIFIPSAATEKDKYAENEGEIIEMGANAFHDWEESERPKIGDKVLTTKYPGLTKSIDGEMYRICDYSDVLAKMED